MINPNLVFAMFLRYIYNWRHNLDRLSDSFYWPAIDLFIWGLTSIWIEKASSGVPNIVPMLLTGVIFWMITWRAQYEISTNILAELWDRNLVNIFITPIRIREWLMAVMALGVFKIILTIAFASTLAFILYSFNIFRYGFYCIPFIISLTLSGWFIGIFISGFVIRFGLRIQTLAWAGPYLLVPFAAIYYPVSILPNWAQSVSQLIPMSYVFEGLRQILFTGTFSYDKLLISFALNIIYLLLSILFFVWMFKKSKKLGLGRLI